MRTREELSSMLKEMEQKGTKEDALLLIQGVLAELLMDMRDQLEFIRLSILKPQ